MIIRNPEVAVAPGQPGNPVVPHAVILRQYDLHFITAKLEFLR
jgi:hypothetical protein